MPGCKRHQKSCDPKQHLAIQGIHELIWKYPVVIASLKERGFDGVSIRYWKLGYCPEIYWRDRSSRGLSDKTLTIVEK